jgi:hypothetical protein
MKTPSETLEALKDSANQSSQSVMQSLPSSSSLSSSSLSSSSLSSSSLSSNSNDGGSTSMFTYIISAIVVIIILAVCGLNVFIYLAKGTQSTSDFIDKFFEMLDPYLGHFFSKLVKFITTIFVIGYETTLGGDSAAEASAGIVGAGLTAMKGPELSSSEVSSKPQTQPEATQMTPQMIQHLDEQQQQQKEQQQNYEPSTAETTTGWCYVGEDEGYRSCLEINPSTTSCASGQVYSSQQKCLKN